MDTMKSMKAVHWVALAMFLGGLATQLSAMHSWSEIRSPQSIAGVLLNVSGTLIAMFSEKPRNGNGDSK